jgi:endonuclease G
MKKILLILLLICSFTLTYSQFKLSNFLPQSKIITKTIDYKYFIVGCDEKDSVTIYSEYLLTKKEYENHAEARTNKFFNSKEINYVHLSDYFKKYDRGHLSNAEDMSYNKHAEDTCFVITNMTPQVPSFNRGIWHTLENYTRKAVENNDSTIIISGIILSSVFDDKTLKVARYNFKIMYFLKTKKYEAYLLENTKSTESLDKFKINIRDLEDETELKFTFIK